MKKKKLSGKLNFRKTTIATLNNQAKNGVVGGKPSYSECGSLCSCDTACTNCTCEGCVNPTYDGTNCWGCYGEITIKVTCIETYETLCQDCSIM